MKLSLQENLEHQLIPIALLNYVFRYVIDSTTPREIEQNPIFNPRHPQLMQNIKNVQTLNLPHDITEQFEKMPKPLPAELQTREEGENSLVLDIKMETGTGKTYVYTRSMYELYKNYGFNKFIILVPSLAIKEGTKHFLMSDYAKKHFEDIYGVKLHLSILSSESAQNGRKLFPSAVREFVNATSLEKNTIHVLLTNSGMLGKSKNSALMREYDQTLFDGIMQPYAALKYTKPIVIIDEPHKFKRSASAYETVISKISPQAIIRFGATFPESNVKKGHKKDYANLLYDLGSCDAFNLNLIKGIEVSYLENSDDNEKYRLIDVSGKNITFRNEESAKKITLSEGDTLVPLDSKFEGIRIDKVENKLVHLSNSQIISINSILLAGVYSGTYQEKMIELALDLHFEKELSNASRNVPIKTLALFFIDSINSYRPDNKDEGTLKISFEKILRKKLENVCNDVEERIKLGENLSEYLNYLKTSLQNISKTHGGYFSKDNSAKEDDIQREVEEILNGKEKLLSFKNETGEYNLRRFIFSKWTLKEGWDNPNVFTIAKLRSSGSEDSKLQEVGRGLRLPVDIYGNRISNEQFYLNYVVDCSEEDFAERLVREINSDTITPINLKDVFTRYAEEHHEDLSMLFGNLLINKLIDSDWHPIPETEHLLYEKYPELFKSLNKGKVINRNKKEVVPQAHIRKENFNKLKEIWEELNKRYVVSIAEIPDDMLLNGMIDILKSVDAEESTYFKHTKRIYGDKDTGGMRLVGSSFASYNRGDIIPYNKYLKLLHDEISIPIPTLHKAFVEVSKSLDIDDKYFSGNTLQKIIVAFKAWRREKFSAYYRYEKINVNVSNTRLTENGKVCDSVP